MVNATRYSFVEQGADGEPVDVIISEQEIIDYYYKHWYRKGIEVNNQYTKKMRQMTLEQRHRACIDDFCVVHWCVALKD